MKLKISQLREMIKKGISQLSEEKKKGLWANIAAKRKRGEKPAKPGDKGYPDRKAWKKLTKESDYNRDTIRRMVEEEVAALNERPAKGKAKQKITKSGKKVSYGQAGKAKGGGPRVKPGTSKGDSYCARSLGIKKGLSKKKQNDPNTPNNLSRKRWKCSGAKSNK